MSNKCFVFYSIIYLNNYVIDAKQLLSVRIRSYFTGFVGLIFEVVWCEFVTSYLYLVNNHLLYQIILFILLSESLIFAPPFRIKLSDPTLQSYTYKKISSKPGLVYRWKNGVLIFSATSSSKRCRPGTAGCTLAWPPIRRPRLIIPPNWWSKVTAMSICTRAPSTVMMSMWGGSAESE